MKLSPNFGLSEFLCSCGCGEGVWIVALLVASLEELRVIIGKPIIVTSGFRCLNYNRQVGSKDTSQHVLGRAADVVVDGMTPEQVADAARHVPAFRKGGIGIYDDFTHLDVRQDGPARWDYRTNEITTKNGRKLEQSEVI